MIGAVYLPLFQAPPDLIQDIAPIADLPALIPVLFHHPVQGCGTQVFIEGLCRLFVDPHSLLISVHGHQTLDLDRLPFIIRVELAGRGTKLQHGLIPFLLPQTLTDRPQAAVIPLLVERAFYHYPLFPAQHGQEFPGIGPAILQAQILPLFHGQPFPLQLCYQSIQMADVCLYLMAL